MKDKKQNIVSRVLAIVLALAMMLPVGTILSTPVSAETNDAILVDDNITTEYVVYGNIVHTDGKPVGLAIVTATNMATEENTTIYAEAGTYLIELVNISVESRSVYINQSMEQVFEF